MPNSSKLPQFKPQDWSYSEIEGKCCLDPGNWPSGTKQSPIALHTEHCEKVVLEKKDKAIKFINYDHLLKGELVNSGHSVTFNPDPGQHHVPRIEGGQLDQPYDFLQYHFHWSQNDTEGSEHSLNGQHFPVELHLVHKGHVDPSKFAVLAVFLNLTAEENSKKHHATDALKVDAAVFDAVKDFGQKARLGEQKLATKLPHNTRAFIRYGGSLTTPPCTENVEWTVFTEPVPLSREQLQRLRTIHDCHGQMIRKNARPIQECGDRKILHLTCQQQHHNNHH